MGANARIGGLNTWIEGKNIAVETAIIFDHFSGAVLRGI